MEALGRLSRSNSLKLKRLKFLLEASHHTMDVEGRQDTSSRVIFKPQPLLMQG